MWKTCILTGAILLMRTTVPSFAESRPADTPAGESPIRVLMITGGLHHDFDVLPRKLADALNSQHDLQVRVTSDLTRIGFEIRAGVDVLLFNTCINQGLPPDQRKEVLDALKAGKGLVGMHGALWSFQDWPEWRVMLGGVLKQHAPYGRYTNAIIHPSHPIAGDVAPQFSVVDELYFADERSRYIDMIVRTTGVPEGRPGREPQAWTNRYMGGRVFVTTFGHDHEVLREPAVLTLLANGLRWAAGHLGPATALSGFEREAGFTPLFDGTTFEGWRCEPSHWRVEKGTIVGQSPPQGLRTYSYLCTTQEFDDFIVRCSLKLASGNSGVQFRSTARSHLDVSGYQADVVPGGWGILHEMNGRGNIAVSNTPEVRAAANPDDWNDIEVTCRGPRVVIRVNGVVTADWTETNLSRPRKGVIAFQLHEGEPMEVHVANVRLKRFQVAAERPTP